MTRKSIIRFSCAFLLGLGAIAPLSAQETRSLPFLEVASDARSAAMGGSTMGEARTAYLYTNPTSFLITEKPIYGSYSFGAYTTKELSGIQFHALSGGYRLGTRHAFLVGGRYYKGLHTAKEDEYGERKVLKPMDYSIDVAYAYSFNEHWSGYVMASFIQSYVGKVAFTGGGSAGLYYRNSLNLQNTPTRYTVGLSVDNIGGKVQYGKKGYEGNMPGSIALGGDIFATAFENVEVGLSMTHRMFFEESNGSRYMGAVGLEAGFSKKCFIRTGMQIMKDNNALTLGAGYLWNTWKPIMFDLTYRKGLNNSGFDSLWAGISIGI